MSNLLIVESPAKSKTISKYLGKDFIILPSYGHVRGIPNKSKSVRPDKDFDMSYDILEKSQKAVDKIIKEVFNKKALYLATDPDREGEAIAWHIVQILKENNVLGKIQVFRVVFNEITKKAVSLAVANPREIDLNLVYAQRARQALDYLVGFTLSPVLWRKLPGSRSAGRVQSVALKLICERETEIKKFISEEYWDISVKLKGKNGDKLVATLTHIDAQRIDKFYIKNESQATSISEDIATKEFVIKSVTVKEIKRSPYPPFITSTLQQEMSSKLGFSAKKTMTVAQKLYEGIEINGELVGLITYMRTDGLYLAQEAISDIRSVINNTFGKEYLPDSPRTYDKKIKNAQEAHEAIRPTNILLFPEEAEKFLNKDEFKLYSLIWKRTIASQMESAVYENTTIILDSRDRKYELRCSSSLLKFDGFNKVYKEEQGEDNEGIIGKKNPKLGNYGQFTKGDDYMPLEVIKGQHFTEPPPRYTEASLIKKMEELGIGRPSTYASIISVIQDRGYVILLKKNFIPENRGIILTSFLNNFFAPYVEYNFTANLENSLDLVSSGEHDWKELLHSFWGPFIENIKNVEKIEIPKVLEAISVDMLPYINLPANDDGVLEAKVCNKCNKGKLSINISKHGIFLGCSSYPECNYTESILSSNSENNAEFTEFELPKVIATTSGGEEVLLNRGPYGFYIQCGMKKISLVKNLKLSDLTEEIALKLLELPKELGEYEGEVVKLGSGPYGLYILYKKKFYNVDSSFLDKFSLDSAIEVIKSGGTSGKVRVVGIDQEGREIAIYKGRYGFYIKHGLNNFAIPKKIDHNQIGLEESIEIISKKEAKG